MDQELDSLERRRAELSVRSDSGAKGRKARRVPITPRLAAIKHYTTLHRPESESPALLVSRRGGAFVRGGIDAMMSQLQRRVGLRVQAHAV